MGIEKINSRQLFFILTLMRVTVIIAFLPALSSADAYQDAWMSALAAFFLAGFFVFLIAYLGMKYPDKSIVGYSREILGKWGGAAVCIFTFWTFLFMAGSDLRIYAEVITTGFLVHTPIVAILVGMVLVAAVAAYCGIEVIARAADFMFPFYIIAIIASLVVAVPSIKFGCINLQPVLARGPAPILRGTIVPTGIIAQYLVLTVLIPHLNKPKKTLRIALGALGLATIILVLFCLAVVVVLGPQSGARQLFPVFAMVRNLQISTFLERFEVLTIFSWGFGLFIGISTFLYCGAKGLAELMQLKNYRPLIAPLAVIWIVSGYHEYRNIFILEEVFAPKFFGMSILFWFLLTIVPLWLVYLIKKPGKGRGNEE